MAGISVGDATLTFLGDTTNLDATLSSIGPRTKAAVAPATDAMGDLGDSLNDAAKQGDTAFKQVGTSARGATEQVRFLGEEAGVRLPRAMARLVAELPGLGVAMNAAFSAVAVIFFAKMLADATDKVSKFAAAQIYHTDAIEKQIAALAAEGKIIVGNIAAIKAANDEMDRLTEVRTPLEKLNDTLKDQEATFDRLGSKSGEFARTTINEDATRAVALQKQIDLTKEQITLQEKANDEEANAKALSTLKEQISLRKQLAEVQVMYLQAVHGLGNENADEMRYKISVQALTAQLAAEKSFGKDSLNTQKELVAQIEQLQTEHVQKMSEEFKKNTADYEAALENFGKSFVEHTEDVSIATTVQQDKMHQLADAASKLGITLKTDLVFAYQQAVAAQKELSASGLATAADMAAATAKVNDAKNAIANLGKAEEDFKEKTNDAWQHFMADVGNANLIMDQVKFSGEQAFEGITKSIQGAFAQIVLGQGNVGRELEKATAQVLASIASQAAVKALFYTAEGFAMLAGFMPGSAAQYFEAAGLMGAVAVSAGAAGRALSGASGGAGGSGGNGASGGEARGPNNDLFAYGSSQSNTGSQAGSGRSSVGVQGFAAGALITAPTLATFAENGPEAAIPLNDPDAMDAIGKAVAGAIAVNGGGATHIHFHAPVVGASDVSKLCKQINKRVGRGQANLTSSNSMRITRRSA